MQSNKISLDELYHKLDLYDSPNTSETKRNEIYNELAELKEKSYNKSKSNILPNTTDPDFVKKLLQRGEFSINKSRKENKLASDIDNFILLQNQIFIKKLLSPETPYRSLLLYHNVGSGKCHSLDTPILMYDGTIKKVQDIIVGDKIMGDDSTSREVLELIRGKDIMYEIVPTKGESFTVNSDHILCLKETPQSILFYEKNSLNRKYSTKYIDKETFRSRIIYFASREEAENFILEKNNIIDISVKDFLNISKTIQRDLKLYKTEINFKTKNIDFDPYLLGFWLGDSSQRDSVIATQDSVIIKYIKELLPKYNLMLNYQSGYEYRISAITGRVNLMLKALQKYNMINNKHIPNILKCNSREIRLQVLAGLIDSDGHLVDNCYEFVQKNEIIMDDVIFLARSLGFSCYKSIKKTAWTHKGIKKHSTAFCIKISGNINDIPIKIHRKIARPREQIKNVLVNGFKIIEKSVDNYYGFTLNRNNRYVMGDFTVTHNSCTSAHIVENFKDYFNKRALIIMQPGLQDNYKKELFNIAKYSIENDDMKQCLGNEYLHKIPNRKIYDNDKLNKIANKLIRKKYEFMGYGQLANVVEKEIEKFCPEGTRPENCPKFIESIDKLFSDRVIIIDEVHNMKNSKEKDSKLSAKVLQSYILKYSKNTILVLLSATPMYDSPEEILWIMNTLLLNDKRKPIKSIKLFDNNLNINPDFANILTKWSNNYVSYMKSSDPKHFPSKLYPTVNNDNSILKKEDIYRFDIYGNEIKGNQNIDDLVLLKTEMSEYQKTIYNILKRQNKKFMESEEIKLEEEEDNENKKNIFFDLSQISNVVFSKSIEYNEEEIIQNLNQLYSDTGFRNVFTSELTNDHKYKVSYKSNHYIFDKKNLRDYSPKINKIINYINNSKGIIFVYSRFLNSGIIPLAIALEHQGYTKYGSNANILKPTKDMNIKSKNKKYMIISGNNPPVSSNYIKELEILKSEANSNGDIIKIVLVTTKGIEGLDFKNIREIHIMEPWFNLSRIAQIVGRGIRNNSHITLPEKERNTTIYQYVNLIKNDIVETIDYRWYRRSEIKQKQISKIERIIKESSIDCNLHKDILIQPKTDKLIVSSQGIEKMIEIGDRDFSKECDYEECELNCKPTVEIRKYNINNKKFIKYETEYTKKIIKFYLSKIKKLFFTIEEIKDFYMKNLNENYEILYNALYELESKKEVFKIKNVEGFIIYRSNFYIFQPLDIDNTKISIESRKDKKFNKPSKILLKKKDNNTIIVNTKNKLNSNITQIFNIDNILNTISIIFKDNEINIIEIYNILIDKLSIRNRYLLFNYCGDNTNNDTLKETLKSSLKTNKLFIFDDNNNFIAYYDIFEKNPIKFKCYNPDNKSFEICNTFDNARYIELFINTMKKYLSNKNIDIHGFCEINQAKNKCDIKMLDKINPAPKSKGTVCGFNPLNKEKLTLLIERILKKNLKDSEKKKLKKDNLCILYEYVLRINNIESIKFLTTDIQIYMLFKKLK